MNAYVKTLKTALGNRYISLPLYALAGTSAFFFLKHIVSKKDRTNHETQETENFRSAATQFENRQLGVAEQLTQGSIEIPPSELNESLNEITADVLENTEQCRAITVKGTRCRKKAVEDGYCHIHKPQ